MNNDQVEEIEEIIRLSIRKQTDMIKENENEGFYKLEDRLVKHLAFTIDTISDVYDFNEDEVWETWNMSLRYHYLISFVVALKRIIYTDSVAKLGSDGIYKRIKEKMVRLPDRDAIMDISGFASLHGMIMFQLAPFEEGFVEDANPLNAYSPRELIDHLGTLGYGVHIQ